MSQLEQMYSVNSRNGKNDNKGHQRLPLRKGALLVIILLTSKERTTPLQSSWSLCVLYAEILVYSQICYCGHSEIRTPL